MLYKNQRREKPAVYVREIDSSAGLVRFSYLTGGEDEFKPRNLVNGREVLSVLPSGRRTDFMGRTYFREHFFWVPMEDGDSIAFELDGELCRIRHGGTGLGDQADWMRLRTALTPSAPKHLDADTLSLRAHVVAMREKYHGCCVLMDRDDRADDNAEHLYRHMMATGRADNAWFILSRDSMDWNRLEAEGFKLLPFGSDEHVAAQMNAAVLISSHTDHYVLWPVPKKDFADLAHYQFVFLQHGVTTNDMSDWLNPKPIRLFITTMPKEAADISQSVGNYKFTERETLLSGFPRHDRLLEKAREGVADSILIMPTWRKYLTVEGQTAGERRGKIEGFSESDFAKNWRAVLNSSKLRDLAHKQGLRIVFAPHPNLAMYLEDMDLPDWIETVDVRRGVSYQDLLARARVAITDFSSAVTEVAYLQRSVIYFQFDPEEIFKGDHVYKKGYFSFERDGFGPVVANPDDVMTRVQEALSGREDPVYAERRQAAFPFRDGGCCERVCTAIERLFDRRPVLSPLHATRQNAQITEASQGR